MSILLEPFRDLLQCCSEPGTSGADAKAEAQRILEGWRPAVSAFALSLAAKRKNMDDEEEEMKGEEEEDEEDVDKGSLKSGSERSGASLSDSSGEDDAQKQQLQDIRNEKTRQIARMEFEPILALIEPEEDEEREEYGDPADLIQAKRKGKKKRVLGAGSSMSMGEAIEWVRKILKEMDEEHKDVELPSELASSLGVEERLLRDAVAYAGDCVMEIREDDDGNQVFEKMLGQKIWEEIFEGDGEPVSVVQLVDVLDCTEDEVLEAVEDAGGVLELFLKKKNQYVKAKEGVADMLDRTVGAEVDEETQESELRAIEFRRIQVQRKAEDFLRQYTKGQNLVKIVGNKRYNRRVYLDTGRKSLTIQGASGPKHYMFEDMREIDMESRTTKEGRLETIVTIAVERSGVVHKELVLSFPDQQKGNTFVNCLSLFAMALRRT